MPKTYTTIQGDMWDIISKKNYGSEKFVDVLIEANYEHRETIFFAAGVVLTIPDVDTSQRDSRNLPPWKVSQ